MRYLFSERVKTITLILLITSSMFLTYRLWFNDHNLFNIFEYFGSAKRAFSGNGLSYIYTPNRILINNGENSHIMVRPTNQEYSEIQKEGLDILRKVLTSSKIEITDKQSWNKLMASKSILIGYEINMPVEALLGLLNIRESNIKNNVAYIKEMIIMVDNSVSDNIKCYIKNDNQDAIFFTAFKFDSNKLTSILKGLTGDDFENYVTGFEVKHKLLKDDILILPTDSIISSKKVRFESEFDIDSTIDVKKLTQYFFKKYNVIKNIDYLDESKTNIVSKEFIDRKNILKLFKEGKLEYTTTDIPNAASQTDLVTALKLAVSFVESNLGFPENSYISEIKMEGDSRYTFGFDYYVNGLKVSFNNEKPRHAIEIEVIGNSIYSYKRIVNGFKLGKTSELNVMNLEAIDDAILSYREKTGSKISEKAINHVELVYMNDETENEVYPYWYIRIDEQDFFINSMDEEN